MEQEGGGMSIHVCDKCGTQVSGNYISEVLYKNNRENLKSELCQLCFEELKKFLKSGQETIRR